MRSVSTVRNTFLKSSLSILFRLLHFPVPRFPPLQSRAAFSSPAFSASPFVSRKVSHNRTSHVCVCVSTEPGWSSDYTSASHSEQSLANGHDVTDDAVPVAGVIFKSECQFDGLKSVESFNKIASIKYTDAINSWRWWHVTSARPHAVIAPAGLSRPSPDIRRTEVIKFYCLFALRQTVDFSHKTTAGYAT